MARPALSSTAPYGSTPTERVTMARALAALFAAGGALVAATMLLPHSGNTQAAGVWAPAILALVVGALLHRFAGRVGVAELQVLLALGALLITVCVTYGGDSASAYPYLYLWVSLYAYYFFSARAAASLVALCVLLYALAFRLQGDTPVAGVHWLMATGTVLVGGLMIGHLTRAIRAQTADLATVSRLAGGLSDVTDFAQAACESLRGSASADVVIFLEPVPHGGGLQVTAMAGASEAGMAFAGDAARAGLERAFRGGEAAELMADPGESRGRLGGGALGLAQPILRDGVVAGVLAVAWTRPRRSLPERVRSAAVLYAAEASLAMDRAARASEDRERHALEINDNIVQGLVIAKYSAQRGDTEEAIKALDETLTRARRLITDQLQSVAHGRSGRVEPGDLARRSAPAFAPSAPADDAPERVAAVTAG